MVDPAKNTLVTCTIIDSDGRGGPKFQITAADQPNDPIIANSATGAWTVIVRKTNEIRQRDLSNSASGPDYFGFKHPTIAKMVQDLPGARELKNCLWQNFKEMESRAAKGVMAIAEKKRSRLEQRRPENSSPRKITQQVLAMEQTPETAGGHYHHDLSTLVSSYFPLLSQTTQPSADMNMLQQFMNMESDQEIDEFGC
ncbi:F/Y rich C-terminus-domain-containing protein [Parasitella parasitica]|nr:F/Y rich C-terminus-domain-containing protein [Parasitella parasitica]